MKTVLIIGISLLMGYVAGNVLPLINILTPEKEIQFESDFTIKAGTTAKSRYFGTSLEPVDLPVEIVFGHDGFPKFKAAASAKTH